MTSNITAFDIDKSNVTYAPYHFDHSSIDPEKQHKIDIHDDIETERKHAPIPEDEPTRNDDYFKQKLHRTETIWYQDPSVIFKYYYRFVPSANMSIVEVCNAVFRFAIYAALIILIIEKTVIFPILTIVLVAIVTIFLTYNSDEVRKQKNESYVAAHYTVPTKNNPFMNTLISDLNRDDKKEAAKPCDFPSVEKQLQYLYNEGVYREVDDIFNRNNSQNRFHTVPCTEGGLGVLHGDTHTFANWLYSQGRPTCKEDSRYCYNGTGARTSKFLHLKSQPQLLQVEDEKLAHDIADKIQP